MPDAILYPASPADIDEEKLAPSKAFKLQVSKVVVSILLFFVVYFILMMAAVALAIGCFYAGAALIITVPSFLSIMFGIGLIILGASVLFFLIKFIFTVSKDEGQGRIEITEDEQPELFAFIRKLTKETQTTFPKKIFLSPDVNACVFYNSNFWSMFLPVRKNLEIGLGLVNAVNISELKAVIAHEFGHFSQRSMKLGSFTYNVNRVVYNMLYHNNDYTRVLRSLGNIHGIFALFSALTFKIAQWIQWILHRMYRLINKNYMGLSREMEFHADAIAASVAGGNNVVSGLSRIEIAQTCYNAAINTANERLQEKKIAQNIFSNQLSVLYSVANEHRLPIRQGLPEVSFQFLQSFSTSRIIYKNQWASHPELGERKEHLDLLYMNVMPDETQAWEIFRNVKILQEMLTANLYKGIELENAEIYTDGNFEEWSNAEKVKYMLPADYKGFYNKRYLKTDEWDWDTLLKGTTIKDFSEIFTDGNAQIYASILNNENDIAIVRAIKEGQIEVVSFDFDGKKYQRKNADEVIDLLEKEVKVMKDELDKLEKEAFVFFFKTANDPEIIKGSYLNWTSLIRRQEAYAGVANKIIETIDPFYNGNLTIEQVRAIVDDLKTKYEPELKGQFRESMDEMRLKEENNSLYDDLAAFLDKDYAYFIDNKFQDHELQELTGLIRKVGVQWDEYKYSNYKKLLETQLNKI